MPAANDYDFIRNLYGNFNDPKRLSTFDIGKPKSSENYNSDFYGEILRVLLQRKQGDPSYVRIEEVIKKIEGLLKSNGANGNPPPKNDAITIIGYSKNNQTIRLVSESTKGLDVDLRKLMGKSDDQMPFGGIVETTSLIFLESAYIGQSLIDAEQASIYMNSMPPHVLAQCYPFLSLEVGFRRPIEKGIKNLRTPSTLKFLMGGAAIENDASANNLLFRGNIDERGLTISSPSKNGKKGDDIVFDVYKAGMELFTSPQSLNPTSDYLADDVTRGIRSSQIYDRFRPYMSIVSVTINVTPNVGMFVYKKGSLTLKLHDRSRLAELSDFIKAEILTGTSFWLTYGIKYPINPNDEYSNFINNNLTVSEEYGVSNSSYTFESDGSVTINLELYTKYAKGIYTTTIFDGSEAGDSLKKLLLLRDYASELLRANSRPDVPKLPEIRTTQTLEAISSGDFTKFKKSQLSEISSLITPLIKHGNIKDFDSTRFLEVINEVQNDKNITDKKDFQTYLKEHISDKMKNLGTNSKDDYLLDLYDAHVTAVFQASKDDPDTQGLVNNLKVKTTSDKKKKTYVSFGSLFSNLALPAITKDSTATEVQVLFYKFNDKAGPVSRMNISQFPIDIEAFKESFATHIKSTKKTTASLTIEEFMSLVINGQLLSPAAAPYGNRNYYEYDKSGSLVVMKTGKDKKTDVFDKKIESNNKKMLDVFGIFAKPTIEIFYETLALTPKPGDASKKSVLRIHIYDKISNPFPLPAMMLTQGDQFIGSDADKLKAILKNEGINDPEQLNDPAQAAKLQDLVLSNESTKKLKTEIVRPNDLESIKRYVSTVIPYIKYGSNSSLIKSANLSSQTDQLLSSAQMQQSTNKKNITDPNNTDAGGIPMRIIPSMLSMTTFGNPLLRCAQMFFIDFGTGTSADNTYIIKQLTHTITPGSFTTSIEASPIDAYARFYAGGNLLEKLKEFASQIKKLNDSKGTQDKTKKQKKERVVGALSKKIQEWKNQKSSLYATIENKIKNSTGQSTDRINNAISTTINDFNDLKYKSDNKDQSLSLGELKTHFDGRTDLLK